MRRKSPLLNQYNYWGMITKGPRTKPVNAFSTFAAFDASTETDIVIGPIPMILPASAVLSVFTASGRIVLEQFPQPLQTLVRLILPKNPPFTAMVIMIASAVSFPMFFTDAETIPNPPFTSVISRVVWFNGAAELDVTINMPSSMNSSPMLITFFRVWLCFILLSLNVY